MAGRTQQHILERRANLIAQKLEQRVQDMTIALQAADGRLPFHTKLSRGDALDWWMKHRYDSLGQQVIQKLPPMAVFNLDAELAKRVEQKQSQGIPIEGPPNQSEMQSNDLSHLGLQPTGAPTQDAQQLPPDVLEALFGRQGGV